MSNSISRVKLELASIFKKRDKLFEQFSTHCQESILSSENIAVLAERIIICLRLKESSSTCVVDSCRPLLGKKLNPDDLWKLAWRLSANRDRLLHGEAVLPWTISTTIAEGDGEWVVAHIESARPMHDERGERTVRVLFHLLTGRPATEKCVDYWSSKFAVYLSSRFGFSKKRSGKYPYRNSTELSQLRLAAYIDSGWSLRRPRFASLEFPSSLVTRNRSVLGLRSRSSFPCPEGFTDPCHACHVGYDVCPAGTHPRTFVEVKCHRCDREGYSDPDIRHDKVCLVCRADYDKIELSRRKMNRG